MPGGESYVSLIAERTGWTEGQILMFCGATLLAGCATAIVVALRVIDIVTDARS
jgi:hypothetical protein